MGCAMEFFPCRRMAPLQLLHKRQKVTNRYNTGQGRDLCKSDTNSNPLPRLNSDTNFLSWKGMEKR